MNTNKITYENYVAHKKEFGHVSTWALWNEEAKDIRSNAEKDAAIRRELIIANSREEFEDKRLGKLLHGDLVVLALNFSCPKRTKANDHPVIHLLNEYKDEKHNRLRYESLKELVEEQEEFTFFNMYAPAARYYAEGFMKSNLLHGAYMTDFIKFVEEDGELLPAGIPDSNSGSDIVSQCLRQDRIHIQAEGLKKEFDLLGIQPKVILTVSSRLNSKRVQAAISDALGYQPRFERLYHYTPRGTPYAPKYDSYEALYKDQIRQVHQAIESVAF